MPLMKSSQIDQGSGSRVCRLATAIAGLSLLVASCALVVADGSESTSDATTTSLRSSTTRASPSTIESSTTTSQAHPAAVLHVGPNSTAAGDGSIDRPFNELAVALQSLEAGQTLIVHGGTYTEQIKLNDLGVGTADEPIVVRAADGEVPLVVGLLWLSGLEHWMIEGINVTWDDERNSSNQHMVKLDDGQNWRFSDAEIWGARSFAAILVSGLPENFELSGLYVHDTLPANARNQDHLIYLNSGTHGGLIERNLLVGSENGRAIKIGPEAPDGDWVGNLLIRFNTMVDNRGPSNVQFAWRTTGVTLENNLMVGALADRANVTTFELTGGSNLVRNNAGWDSIGVLEPHINLADGGGNVHADPMFTDDGTYRPTNPALKNFGYLAPNG